ncbi:MAG: ATP-dependent Clp protease ATP-binding subunit, partial [Candidatus Marinimicrobia bacterium]|nr:ATP-dependent Clp protease ATP-binding subunit [Candidatus Neomarinimicrobiota bacterium]
IDLFNILLQVFDEGVLTDSLGRKIDFKNTIIIMTSNMGSREYNGSGFGFGEQNSKKNYDKVKKQVMEKVTNTFSPELINRIDETIVFKSLDEESILKIIDLQLKDLVTNLHAQNIQFFMSVPAKKLLLKKGFDEQYGVRPLRREIQLSLEDKISELILENKIASGDKIKVSVKSKAFVFSVTQSKSKKKTMS